MVRSKQMIAVYSFMVWVWQLSIEKHQTDGHVTIYLIFMSVFPGQFSLSYTQNRVGNVGEIDIKYV